MHKPGSEVSFWSAVAMGIGAMIGAGIFALLGQAGTMAGSAVWISFLLGGFVALLSGYSIGRLGARYPSAGGVVEYLVQAFGVGRFSGAMSVMMYAASMVAVSLVARTFGSYAHALLPDGSPNWLIEAFAAAIVLVFMLINLNGARAISRVENVIVLVKMAVLVGFAAIGMIFISPAYLSPATYPPVSMIFYSVAVTFFAYEGFRIVSNAAEDMEDPARTLPRAIMTAIVLVMVVYVAVALSVFGNLPPDRVVSARDFALAEAARPILGHVGFQIVAVAALFATASAINASLYSVTNVTYRLAMLGELPRAFGKPIGHSKQGLVVSSIVIVLLATFFDLSQIAAIGALSMLIIHLTVHIGHLCLLRETGAIPSLIAMAVIANAVAIGLGAYHIAVTSPLLLSWIAAFFAFSFAIEMILHQVTDRTVETRYTTTDADEQQRAVGEDIEGDNVRT
jgi:amino acid transporter